jgi:hypothetical protein
MNPPDQVKNLASLLTSAPFVGQRANGTGALFYALNTGLSRSRTRRMQTKRSDIVRAINELITQRASIIRALYIVSVAANGPRDEILSEFHQAVGDVLEGVALPNLNLTYINKDKVREEAAWLRERRE